MPHQDVLVSLLRTVWSVFLLLSGHTLHFLAASRTLLNTGGASGLRLHLAEKKGHWAKSNSFGELLLPTRNQLKIFIKAEVWISEWLWSPWVWADSAGQKDPAGEGLEHAWAVTLSSKNGPRLCLQNRNMGRLDHWSDKRRFPWSAMCAEESGGGIRPLHLPSSKGFW